MPENKDNLTAKAILAYRRHASVRLATRLTLAAYYRLTPGKAPARKPCPFTDCSGDGLKQARSLATVPAAMLILSRMSMCGPGVAGGAPCLGTGIDKAEWCIRAGVRASDPDHYRNAC